MDGHHDFNYNEGRKIFILTNKGIDLAPEPLKPIIHLLSRNREPMDDPLYNKVQASVRDIKNDPDIRRAAMNLLERDDAIREEGRAEGREQGITEGRAEGKEEGRAEERRNAIEKMQKLLTELHLSKEEILAKLLAQYPDSAEMIKEVLHA